MYIGDYLARRELYSPDRLAIIDSGKDPESASPTGCATRPAWARVTGWLFWPTTA